MSPGDYVAREPAEVPALSAGAINSLLMKPTRVVSVFDTVFGWSSLPHDGQSMLHRNIGSLKKCVVNADIL